MPTPDWRPRISLDLTPEQFEDLNNLIPRGLKKKVLTVMLDCLIEELKKNPTDFIADIITRDIVMSKVMKLGGKE